ncbi:MAG: UDP-N-acetylmuramoyl-L-alanyl-D-glutamate--2,6-diaminopimelate ligase [Acidiferrobacterales bacterium]
MNQGASISRSAHLADLLQGLMPADTIPDCSVTGISVDSREVRPGYLFIGMPGVNSDGRAFVSNAVDNGATVLLLEAEGSVDTSVEGVPALLLHDLRQHLGLILNRFYEFPSSQLTVIGVTGTNGKTTCTQLLGRILDRPNQRCAVIGTLGNGFPGALESATHTTPDVATMHRLLSDFVAQGARAVCMEVSSHALEQDRVAGINFNIAVFTNLTRDHLDYHGDMESYAAAKARLFEVDGLEVAIINLDDEFGRELASGLKDVEVIGFGITRGDVRAENIHAQADGTSMTLLINDQRHDVRSGVYGEFNVSNLLAVASVLKALDWDDEEIAAALSDSMPVPGRMEHFGQAGNGPVVVIDYAHTPDALQHALAALRPHTQGTLWCVFGCGGDRDRGKRPLMGKVADELADLVVLTDDNPRTESPEQIIKEIEQGMRRPHRVVRPRERAVRETIAEASVSDLILLAGKGHEDYQEIGKERLHYSDRELVQEILGEVA